MTSPDHRPPANNPPNPRNKPMTYHILNVPLRVLGVVVGLGLSGVGWGQDEVPELTAVNDDGTTDANTPITVDAPGLLTNDNDTGAGTLTITEVGATATALTATDVGVAIRGSHAGQFTVRDDGSYTFDPNGDFDDVAVGSTRTTAIFYQVTSTSTTVPAMARLLMTVNGALTPLPAVTITPTMLTVQEGGSGAYSVVLDEAPAVTAEINPMWANLGDGTRANYAPATLTFTTADGNWNTAQTFTVTLLPSAADGDTLTLNHRMRRVGEEPDAGVDRGAVMVMVTAAPTPSVTISETTVGITEGATDTYTVALTAAPSGGNVTVTPSSDNTDVGVSGALIFTASNYDTPQAVTVSGDEDVDTDDDTANITHAVVGGGNYATVTTAAGVTVTVTDNDAPGVTISETNVGITEGASGAYTVVLESEPIGGNVTVTPSSNNADVTVSGALIFSAGNWDDVQTVTVSGVEDADTATDTANITHTVAGANYGADGVTAASVRVTVTDNDMPAPPATTTATEEDAVNRVILPDVTREMSDRQMGAIARRMGQARSGGGGGEYSSAAFSASAAAWAAEAMRSGVDGGFDGKAMLGASDFVLPLGASGGGGALGESAAMWGNGDFSQLGGETRKIDWDGDLLSVNAGVDAHLGDELLGGVMLSWNEADIGYTDDTTNTRERGDYDLDMFSIHPYIGNSTPDGRLDWWATLGFGNGDLVIRNKTNNTRSTSDVSMHMVGIGGNNRLHVRGDNELRLKAEAFATGADVKGGKAADMVRLSALDVNTQRMRVALQARRPHALSGGANLTLEVEGGMRYDGGDGETGSGVEVGSALRYTDSARGLTMGVHTRVLLYHGGDYEDFGIGGDVQLNAGADGQGLSLSLAPAYGNASGGADAVWRGGVAAVVADADADLQASLNTRVGYGLPGAAFMLTPYGEMALGEEVQNYRLGLSWGVGRLFDLDLVGERAEKDGVGVEHAVRFEGRVRF